MADLNLDLDYFDHPKTMRLVGILGRGAAEFPIRLWAFLGKFHSAEGRLIGYGPGEIEAVLRWWGEAGVLVDALMKVGFLDRDAEGWYCAHGWTEKQGHIEALKARARAGAEARWGKIRGDAQAMPQALPKDVSSNTPSLPSIPTGPTSQALKTKTGEEGPLLAGLSASEPAFPASDAPPVDDAHPKTQQKPKQGPKRGFNFEVQIPLDLVESESEIKDWLGYKAEKGKRYQPRGLEAFWKLLRKIPATRRRAAVDHSMANNWAGLYEPKGGQDGGETGVGRSGKAGGGVDPERRGALEQRSQRVQM